MKKKDITDFVPKVFQQDTIKKAVKKVLACELSNVLEGLGGLEENKKPESSETKKVASYFSP